MLTGLPSCSGRPPRPALGKGVSSTEAPPVPTASANKAAPVGSDPCPAPAETSPNRTTAEEFDLRKANYQFALRMYRELAPRASRNLVFSPTSVQLCLAVGFAGASGTTRREMAEALSFVDDPDAVTEAVSAQLEAWSKYAARDRPQGAELLLAAALFYDPVDISLKTPFRELAEEHFGTAVKQVSFQQPELAVAAMNGWVTEKTKGLIPELVKLGSYDPNVRLALLNALYFRGRWLAPFEEPRPEPFTLTGGKKVRVPMMVRRKAEVRYGERARFSVLELEYLGGAYSFIVLLPSPGEQLSTLEARLSADTLLSSTTFLTEDRLTVWIPSFAIPPDQTLLLKPVLEALGMHRAFALDAEFHAISDPVAFVSEVYHAARIEVDRYGTVAAAATVDTRIPVSGKSTELRVDRPFLFLVRDNRSGLVLFMGRVVDPRN